MQSIINMICSQRHVSNRFKDVLTKLRSSEKDATADNQPDKRTGAHKESPPPVATQRLKP